MHSDALRSIHTVARRVPRVLGRSLVGSMIGCLAGGAIGVVATAIAHAFGWSGASGWTAVGLSAISLAALAVGGAWIGALRGAGGAVVSIVLELDLIPRLYQLVRPHLQRYGAALQQGSRGAEARAMALAGLSGDHAGELPAAQDLAERVERYIARLIHGALAGGMLRALLGKSESAAAAAHWAEVEEIGQARATEAMAELIRGMIQGPTPLITLVSGLLALLPHALYAALA
jgi:hypothetical protein